ncbi:MAG: hypothetical protein ACC640_05110, partial [bacterium]
MILISLLSLTFIITLPFGRWRVRCRKYSVNWFLAIHLPIPVIILMRLGAHFSYIYIPLFLASTVLGQLVGG